MLFGALSEGSGWRRVDGPSATGEQVPSYISPHKIPKMIKIEVVGKRFVQEMRKQIPQIGCRLLWGEEVVCAGCQHIVRIEAGSSSDIEMLFNSKAIADQRLGFQAFRDAVACTMVLPFARWGTSTRWSDRRSCSVFACHPRGRG